MYVRIMGCNDVEFKVVVRKATKYFAKELLHNQYLRDTSTVTIRFMDNLTAGKTYYGQTHVTRLVKGNGRPRWFCVSIKTGFSEKQTLVLLAHEMVHVKQFVLDELAYPNMDRWKKRKLNTSKIEYRWHPWEIEAEKKEKKLVHGFLNSL